MPEDKAPKDQTASALPSEEEQERPKNALGANLTMGVHFVMCVLVGLAIGYGLDTWLGTRPWIMLGMIFLGFGAGVRSVMKQLDT